MHRSIELAGTAAGHMVKLFKQQLHQGHWVDQMIEMWIVGDGNIQKVKLASRQISFCQSNNFFFIGGETVHQSVLYSLQKNPVHSG